MKTMELKFNATLENEVLARNAIATFVSTLNPSLEELGEIKTIVSEGVSNSIIHGYNFDDTKEVTLKASIQDNILTLMIIDYGKGIEDLKKAKTPHFSSRPDLERAGMGITIMETLSDSFEIKSLVNMGSTIISVKEFKNAKVKQGDTI